MRSGDIPFKFSVTDLLAPVGRLANNPLGQHACRSGFSVQSLRLPELLNLFVQARAEETCERQLKRLSKIAVILIDDFGLASLSDAETLITIETHTAQQASMLEYLANRASSCTQEQTNRQVRAQLRLSVITFKHQSIVFSAPGFTVWLPPPYAAYFSRRAAKIP